MIICLLIIQVRLLIQTTISFLMMFQSSLPMVMWLFRVCLSRSAAFLIFLHSVVLLKYQGICCSVLPGLAFVLRQWLKNGGSNELVSFLLAEFYYRVQMTISDLVLLILEFKRSLQFQKQTHSVSLYRSRLCCLVHILCF